MTQGTKTAYEQPVRDVVLTPPLEVGGRERIFVIPPTIHLGGPEPPKTIRWINKTGKPVHIWLAGGQKFLKSTEDLSQPIRVAPDKELVVGVKDCKGEWQRDYHVLCDAIGNFADGNSPPTWSCP